ncbi:MAG: RluA family pseudouridine synthase [Limnobacter sp.]|nr:RluA family pseudouridine synthase [Limnobacter sp.]
MVKSLNSDTQPSPDRAVLLTVGPDSHDQRLDNFLVKVCKGVPKSHIFRIIRSGEVRVNRGRAEAKTRLSEGDVLRIPPIRVAQKQSLTGYSSNANSNLASTKKWVERIEVLYEDEGLLAISKPSGVAVHGGSGESLGVIEALRAVRPEQAQTLELVHRIDRETSGVLLVSKKRSYLRALQEQLRNRMWKKYYSTLVLGHWPKHLSKVDKPLKKVQAGQKEQKVFVSPDGDNAVSLFKVEGCFSGKDVDFSLLSVQILTGRTHQIRVHTSASGFPIAGDDRYGHFQTNKQLTRQGLGRMFLHAKSVTILHPQTGEKLRIDAPLAPDLAHFLDTLR